MQQAKGDVGTLAQVPGVVPGKKRSSALLKHGTTTAVEGGSVLLAASRLLASRTCFQSRYVVQVQLTSGGHLWLSSACRCRKAHGRPQAGNTYQGLLCTLTTAD